MGTSIASKIILNSRFIDEFEVKHIETADRRPSNNFGKIDISNVCLALKWYLLLFHKLLYYKVDLVYIPICQTTVGFLRDVPFIVLSKIFRKKAVLHLHGGYFREFYNSSGGIMKYIIRKSLTKIDRMIVLGDCLKPLFDGMIPNEKISVVPNGVDIPFDRSKYKNRQKDHVMILFLSNLVETKGFKDVLHSIKKATQYHNNLRFIFAGSWMNNKDELECENYLKTEKINDYVEFKGIVIGRNKTKLLHDADIFVFPTYYPFEGHPLVIVEAMAAGLPIITTEQGCIRESVIHGKNGYIVPHRDPKTISKRIIQLVENPNLRKRMGQQSRNFYEANFTKEHFVGRMISAMNLTLK